MSGRIVLVEPEQLVELIEDAVRRALDEVGNGATPEWLSSRQTAELIGCHAKTVGRLARSKELQAHRVGRAWRFRRSDVEQYLGNGES